MGVYHLAPVGTSPGSVTSALAYLKHNKDKAEFMVRGELVEVVVLFPSWEVWNGEEGMPEECILNDYGQENKRRSWKRGAAVLDIIRDFAKEEFGQDVTLFCSPLNISDYDDCFDKIAKVALRFSIGTGKHLWANLTGGPNIVNAALLEVAFLSGLIARLYYTFLSDVRRYGKYLRPPSSRSEIFAWREVPLVKTAFDEDYYRVVQVLADDADWCEDKELLERLAQKMPERFGSGRMSLEAFRDDFLNKMDGRELVRETLPDERRTNRNRVSDYGRQILERVSANELFATLLYPGRREKTTIDRLTADLRVEKL
ncbi:MAG: hypothetical protein HY731_09000 [Candidatus Tectomicrobia bacterium]|nr:hypothetical protein [Candidatus Tectomicrobia bacterium]